MTRPELFDVVRVTGIRTFAELVDAPRHRPRLRDLQAGGGVDVRLARRRATSSTASRPACRTPTTTSSPTSSATAPTRWCPGCPAARSPRSSSSPSARSPATSTSTRRSPAASASTCSAPGSTQLPGHLGAARRRRLRVGPRLRQGGAHGEVVRRLDVVPLRRAGLGAARHRPRAPLPGPAGAAQDQAGRVGLRPRVRRGAEQGRRRHRHRAGLEPLRRRQRRHAPGPRRSCSPRTSTPTTLDPLHRPLPHVVRPHRRPARAHRDLAAQAARRHRPRAPGRASTTRSASRAELEADMARHVDDLRVRVGGDARRPRAARPLRLVRQRPPSPTRRSPTSRSAASGCPAVAR